MSSFDDRLRVVLEVFDPAPAKLNLDLGELDPDPVFRKVVYALNNAGYTTHASCQGHNDWENDHLGSPQLLVKGPKRKRLARVIARSGLANEIEIWHPRVQSKHHGEEMIDITFPQDVDWSEVYEYLAANL